MATTPAAPVEKAADAPVEKASATALRVRPVYGDMVNPFTQQWLPQGESKKVVVDAWIQAQVDAGKLVESDD